MTNRFIYFPILASLAFCFTSCSDHNSSGQLISERSDYCEHEARILTTEELFDAAIKEIILEQKFKQGQPKNETTILETDLIDFKQRNQNCCNADIVKKDPEDYIKIYRSTDVIGTRDGGFYIFSVFENSPPHTSTDHNIFNYDVCGTLISAQLGDGTRLAPSSPNKINGKN